MVLLEKLLSFLDVISVRLLLLMDETLALLHLGGALSLHTCKLLSVRLIHILQSLGVVVRPLLKGLLGQSDLLSQGSLLILQALEVVLISLVQIGSILLVQLTLPLNLSFHLLSVLGLLLVF